MAQQNRNKNKNSHGGQIVKFTKGKYKFQVITNKGSVLKYRDGALSFSEVLLTEQIFGKTLNDFANESDLKIVFGTQDTIKCGKEIVKNGELQYTQQERKEFIDLKRKQIANYIHENYIYPATKLPHPRQRILDCMKECKIKIDPDRDTIHQSLSAVQKMNGKLIFVAAKSMIIRLIIKHSYYGKVSNIINRLVSVINKNWNDIGCILTIQCTPKNWDNLQSKIYKATNGGDYDFKDITDGTQIKIEKEENKNNHHYVSKKGKRKNKLKIKDQKEKPKLNGKENNGNDRNKNKRKKKIKNNYKKERNIKNRLLQQ